MINLWVLISTNLIQEFQAQQADPENYTGVLTEKAIAAMSSCPDGVTVQQLFSNVQKNGKTFLVFSVYVREDQLDDATMSELYTNFADDFEILGAWTPGGNQFGTSYDENGELVGDAAYPIPADAYLIMHDAVTYDENGNETSRIPASSNADLRDINLLAGQAPRQFT